MKKFLLPLAFLCATGVGTPLLAVQPLPDDVADTLQYMREEEKLARDVYLYFAETYSGQKPGSNVFARIAKSEQRHTDAVKKMLDKYGVVDPAVSAVTGELNPPGTFTNDDLQTLYNELVDDGDASYVAALGVGVTIEEKDIEDITAAIEEAMAYPDIVRVYSNLLAGSYNHLAAFENVLAKAGTSTAPAPAAPAAASGGKGKGAGAGR